MTKNKDLDEPKYKDPAVLFYTADFLVGVAFMTMAERGEYITLLCMQHQTGHISPDDFASVTQSKKVISKFDTDENGFLFQHRMEAETEARRRFVESRRENGALGGRPKKPKQNLSVSSRLTYTKPKQNLSENENINENINSNSIGIDRGTNLEEAPQITAKEERFNRFWQAYPKKRAKEDARKRWEKLNPSEDLLLTMLSAIDRQKRSPEWLKENGQYIPYPATWLHRGQWQDEADEPVKEAPKYSSFSADDAFTRAVERSYAEE